MERIIQKEAESVVEGQTVEQEAPQGEAINLNDVAFMIMVGRKKDGTPFMHNVGVNDVFTIDGLLEYGKRELAHAFSQHFQQKGSV